MAPPIKAFIRGRTPLVVEKVSLERKELEAPWRRPEKETIMVGDRYEGEGRETFQPAGAGTIYIQTITPEKGTWSCVLLTRKGPRSSIPPSRYFLTENSLVPPEFSYQKFHSLPFVSCLGPFGFSPFRPVFPPFGSVCGLREVGVLVVVPLGFWRDVPYMSVS